MASRAAPKIASWAPACSGGVTRGKSGRPGRECLAEPRRQAQRIGQSVFIDSCCQQASSILDLTALRVDPGSAEGNTRLAYRQSIAVASASSDLDNPSK